MRTLRRSQSFSDLQHPSLQYSQLSAISELNITNSAARISNKPAVPRSHSTLPQTKKSRRRSKSVLSGSSLIPRSLAVNNSSNRVRLGRSTVPENRYSLNYLGFGSIGSATFLHPGSRTSTRTSKI